MVMPSQFETSAALIEDVNAGKEDRMSDRSPIEPPRPVGYPTGPGGPSSSSGDGGRGLWPVVLVLVALAAAIALVAGAIVFTSGDPGKEQVPLGGPATSAVTAPPKAPTAADPQAATKAEVIAAYRAGWEAQLAIGRDPKATADDDRLRASLTGDNLAAVQLSLVRLKSGDEVYVGEVKLNPKVVELDATTAVIEDCVDDATGTVNAVTGRPVQPATRAVKLATVRMKLVDASWKTSNYKSVEASCVPAAS